jgi:hypothetical protein
VVNGVHFDDSQASIVDDDGVSHARSELKLGMLVDVEAGPVSIDAASQVPTAVATSIHFGRAIDGPVQGVNTAASTLTVLGQTVKVDEATVFAGTTAGLAGLHAGQLVQVFALLDAQSGVYTATRIELVSSLSTYRLRGVVSQLDTTAKTFSVGAARISYANVPAASLPSLANGSIVKLKLQTVPQGGLWVLANAALAASPAIPDDTEAKLEGIVAQFASLASWRINGTPVDASGADVVFRGGIAADIANGVRVEVEGTMHGGVLVASSVEIKKTPAANKKVDLHGDIQSVNPAAHTFVVRDNTVTYDAATNFVKGTAADLAVGVEVDVKGELAANGTQVYATKIKLGK